jgi:hypothetical protein
MSAERRKRKVRRARACCNNDAIEHVRLWHESEIERERKKEE